MISTRWIVTDLVGSVYYRLLTHIGVVQYPSSLNNEIMPFQCISPSDTNQSMSVDFLLSFIHSFIHSPTLFGPSDPFFKTSYLLDLLDTSFLISHPTLIYQHLYTCILLLKKLYILNIYKLYMYIFKIYITIYKKYKTIYFSYLFSFLTFKDKFTSQKDHFPLT